jgi:methylated-DNA-[protein]-cysteine S-methyltransferase
MINTNTHYCLFATAIGACGVAWSDVGVTRLQLPEADATATERRLVARMKLLRNAGAAIPDYASAPSGLRQARASQAAPAEIDRLIADVQCYMSGHGVDFAAVALDLTGVETFHRKVYEAARAVPWGRTVSYGELARQTGSPGAARAVGQALSRNPVPIIIPCHRVLAKGHRVGGFSAHGGTVTKERLLALEGLCVEAGTPLLPGFV